MSSTAATQITSDSGLIHIRNAAGTGNGSQGSSVKPSSSSGSGEAPLRPRIQTIRAAMTGATAAAPPVGSTAILGPSAAAKPIVPCDNHAASAAKSAAAMSAVRDIQRGNPSVGLRDFDTSVSTADARQERGEFRGTKSPGIE